MPETISIYYLKVEKFVNNVQDSRYLLFACVFFFSKPAHSLLWHLFAKFQDVVELCSFYHHHAPTLKVLMSLNLA